MALVAEDISNSPSMRLDQSESSFQAMDQSESDSLLTDQSDFSLFKNPANQDADSDTPDDEKETYYFESDHVALRGNHDYQVLLKTIALLEAQRIQAVKDLDLLYEGRQAALSDPIQFVQKLQKGIDLNLPRPQKIAELPHISWEKYTSTLDFSTFGSHRHMTRLKKQLTDGNVPPEEVKMVSAPQDVEGAVIRGRVKTEEKPQTFNQLWTTEEQKRLEELLIQFPPEEIEARRFQKIAAALGNRTTLQVQSRVQKYFIKLAKAGLPIPGRMPSTMNLKKKVGSHRHHRYNRMYYNSTFLASVTPPVFMTDNDDENSQSYEGSVTSGTENWDAMADEDFSDDEGFPLEFRGTEEYQELLRLKQLRNRKIRQSAENMTEHVGFKCDRCECEPIVGTRWHCMDCPPDLAVDFCDECVDSGYESSMHNSSHRLKPKRSLEGADSGFRDTDYMGFLPGGSSTGYNYLDPNYMPAS
ncbi:ZZ-type zinc finger-containing protein 3-like isoform X3 [Dreissena polymorpha]|uniref:ZZ-type zinc finger-containing protein 3-like isoform X3 n=1 Tax=Dreissena polymorpha TaxID=45954 RepID=UPI00226466B4|nr:ZZ-type zinc finger-containing protein 3-like isoform X3 [Dreissena polymorpha]